MKKIKAAARSHAGETSTAGRRLVRLTLRFRPSFPLRVRNSLSGLRAECPTLGWSEVDVGSSQESSDLFQKSDFFIDFYDDLFYVHCSQVLIIIHELSEHAKLTVIVIFQRTTQC